MKKIAFAFIAALAVLSFAGCKKKGGAAEAIAKMETFKGQMCACKAGDKACAEKVEKDMKAYGDSMKGKEPDPKSVTEADKKKMGDLMGEYIKCQQAATGGGMGDMAPPTGTPPAGEPPAGTPPAGEMKKDEGAAPAGEMKKEEGGEMKKEEMKKEEAK